MCIMAVYDKKYCVDMCKQKTQVFTPELWRFVCLNFGRVSLTRSIELGGF